MSTMSDSIKKKLRCITYLSPGVQIEWFETILQYLEEKLGREGYIIHESRWSGPPSHREDPFTADEVDIGFFCSSVYLRMRQRRGSHIELCKAAPVHSHPNGQNRPVYFSDVVVRADERSKYTTFSDLRGHSFAYNGPDSLSGSLMVLAELKKLGYNASFFGNLMHSGSHHRSLQMILDKKADAAAIDSNALQSFLHIHPEYKDKLAILTSFGPMPIYPIVFNSRMSAEDQRNITESLLAMHKNPEWHMKMTDNNVQCFVPITDSFYDMEKNIMDLVKGLSLSTAYY